MQIRQKPTLVRKQSLLSENQVQKLRTIAEAEGTSAVEILRRAIDAFDPDALNVIGESDLMDFVSVRLKVAIKATQATRKRLNKTLAKLAAG